MSGSFRAGNLNVRLILLDSFGANFKIHTIMKNFIFLKLFLTFVILFSISTLTAQQEIVEYSIGISDNVNYKRIFEKENYTKIEDGDTRKTYVQKQPLVQGTTERENKLQDVTLSINLFFDPGEYDAPYAVSVYDEDGNNYRVVMAGTNSASIEVPEGTYDIKADFTVIDGFTNYIVIKELVDVSSGTTVDIDVAEATNYVSIDAYNENGEPLEPGVVNPTTGTLSTIFLDRSIIFSSSYRWFVYAYNVSAYLEESAWNFYINDVSERYSVAHTMAGTGFEQNSNYFYKFAMLNGISNYVTLVNNPEDWVFHREKFQPSLLSSPEEVYPAFSTAITYDGNFVLGLTFSNTVTFNIEDGFKAYLNNPLDDNPIDLLVYPGIMEHVAIVDPNWGEESFFMKGNPIVKDGNDITYGSGASTAGPTSFYFLGYDYYYTGEYGVKSLPFHSRFSFQSSENTEIVQGNNVPLCVTQSGATKTNYIGRYGELRESDFFTTAVELQQDGETLFSGNYMNGFVYYDLPETGNFDLTYTNTNINVDGLEGKNTTQLLFDKDQEDFSPPTVQHLQFRNAEGMVTDRFATAEEGFVRLAAGDFNFDEGTFSYEYKEGNEVEFFYSLHDQEDWEALELTEYPEHFFMPAFGDYYEASLASIQTGGNNVWYDVKIVCTDAAGNKQIQAISPAFKLNSTLSTEDIHILSELMVYPNPFSEELRIQLPENVKGNYTFKVTDITGRTIFLETRNTDSANSFIWNGASLSKGMYVFSILSKEQVVAKRIIKN